MLLAIKQYLLQTIKVTKYKKLDIESFFDDREPDIQLACFNWCVDVYIFTDQLSKAMQAKWSRANYLLGVR